MKHILKYIWVILAVILTNCSNGNLYDEMPSEIQTFISQYFPNAPLESFTSSDNTYTVTLKSSATLTFDSDCKWIKLNGNGSTLPQVLLFDDFPPALYEYLQETENTNNVYVAARNPKIYTVELHDYTITYDIATGEITGDDEPIGA